MKYDKLKTYILEITLIIILFFALLVSNIINNQTLSIILIIYTIVAYKLLPKKKILSMYKNQVLIIMLIFSFIYLTGFYLMGLYFGYYSSINKFGIKTITNYIIPISIIIISSELLRSKLISQKVKASWILTFIITVLIDILVYATVYDVTKLNDFLTVLGFILFASVSCNLLFNYISTRYGTVPIIIYRLITVLYVYFIPIVPDVYIFFRSFLRMIYPYIIYSVLEYTYSKSNMAVAYKDKKMQNIRTLNTLILMMLLIMLISCRFKYGALVIGTGSMTGTINKGDAVIYTSYRGEQIKIGDIIVFDNEGVTTVHRVSDIKKTNNEYRYFTKGDANDIEDEGYRTNKNLKGKVNFKIKYIGYPTLWLRDIFK